jgi:hypothetical protein
MSHPDGEKRDAERIQILGELRGEVMIFQPVAIKEISIGGADIESGFALQPNSLHDFRLSLGERSVVVKGRVVRCAISDVDQEIVLYRSGVEFVELSDRVRSAITEFVDGLRTGRTP